MASSTTEPVLASLASTSSNSPRLSGALPGSTSTAVISWLSVSTTMAALCPLQRRRLLLCRGAAPGHAPTTSGPCSPRPWRSLHHPCTPRPVAATVPTTPLHPLCSAAMRCRSALSSADSPYACLVPHERMLPTFQHFGWPPTSANPGIPYYRRSGSRWPIF